MLEALPYIAGAVWFISIGVEAFYSAREDQPEPEPEEE